MTKKVIAESMAAKVIRECRSIAESRPLKATPGKGKPNKGGPKKSMPGKGQPRSVSESDNKFNEWLGVYLSTNKGINFDLFKTVKEWDDEVSDFVEDSGTKADYLKACKDAGMTSGSKVMAFQEEDAIKAVKLLASSGHKSVKFGDWIVYHIDDIDGKQVSPIVVFNDPEEMFAFSFIK